MSDLRIPLDYEEKQLHRSVWNLSLPKVTTLMQCLNVPIMFEIMKPKDDFEVDYEYALQSMPMVGQLLNNWKLRIFCFKSDLSNYYSWMDNNARTKVDDIKKRQHHFISPFRPTSEQRSYIFDQLLKDCVPSDKAFGLFTPFFGCIPAVGGTTSYNWVLPRVETVCVQSDSCLDFIGLPRGFFSMTPYIEGSYSVTHCFNADYLLTYLDSVRNYLVNNQYEIVPYSVSVPIIRQWENDRIGWSGFKHKIFELSLSEIDEFFLQLRMQKNGADIMKVASDANLNGIMLWLSSLKYGGLFHAQYERDMLTSLLYSNNYDDVLIQVDENGNFSINQLRFANRSQLKSDREGIAGGRYSNELRTVWGAKNDKKMDIPELVGVNSFVVGPRGVVTTADTYDPETGQGNSTGQLNGLVNTRDDSKYKHKLYTDNHCIMMFMVQLVPDVLYSTGLGKGLDIHMFDDEYVPQFDQLGFQDVPKFKYNCLPLYDVSTGAVALDPAQDQEFNRVMGKSLPFIDLISNVGRIHGKFNVDEYFSTWVLQRTFDNDVEVPYANTSQPEITSKIIGNSVVGVVPYANPLKYQYPFTVQSISDPNFVFMIGFDIRAVRSKGKSYMPTLGD